MIGIIFFLGGYYLSNSLRSKKHQYRLLLVSLIGPILVLILWLIKISFYSGVVLFNGITNLLALLFLVIILPLLLFVLGIGGISAALGICFSLRFGNFKKNMLKFTEDANKKSSIE